MNVDIITGWVVECCEKSLWFDYEEGHEAIVRCVAINREESSQRCRHTHSVFAAARVQCDGGLIEDVLPMVVAHVRFATSYRGFTHRVIVDCPAEWNAEVKAFREAEAEMMDALYADDLV